MKLKNRCALCDAQRFPPSPAIDDPDWQGIPLCAAHYADTCERVGLVARPETVAPARPANVTIN